MSKYDAVDHLMNLAAEKPSSAKNAAAVEVRAAETVQTRTPEPGHEAEVLEAEMREPEAHEPEAMEVLAAQISATEPALPGTAQRAAALSVPRVTPGDRGRQLLGALRPFLPVVGGALRMIDHGAVQAVARLLPLLGSAPLPGTSTPAGAPAAESQQALAELLTAFDKREAAAAEELKAQGARLATAEEQLRRVREAVERMVAEEGALSNRLREVTDRARLLTAAVIIVFMLAIAEMVLLLIYLHR